HARQGEARAPFPQAGTAAHELVRRQYEDYVLGRLLVSRGMLPEMKLTELGVKQKLEEQSTGQPSPLARLRVRLSLFPPAVACQGPRFSGSPGSSASAPPTAASAFAAAPAATGAAAGEVPQTVGDWIVERELGRGGMGVIYLGRHPLTGAKAAIKLMLNAPAA